jgi:hypothetical protein
MSPMTARVMDVGSEAAAAAREGGGQGQGGGADSEGPGAICRVMHASGGFLTVAMLAIRPDGL